MPIISPGNGACLFMHCARPSGRNLSAVVIDTLQDIPDGLEVPSLARGQYYHI